MKKTDKSSRKPQATGTGPGKVATPAPGANRTAGKGAGTPTDSTEAVIVRPPRHPV